MESMPADERAGGAPGEAPPLRAAGTAAGTAIDFHSGEFNQTDDLNDGAGNYRRFDALAGVVTADMRHQEERRNRNRARQEEDAPPRRPRGLPKVPEPRGRKDEIPEDEGPFTVISQGRTLILAADADQGLSCADTLRERGLDCTLWVLLEDPSSRPLRRFEPFRTVERGGATIRGAFGGFWAAAAPRGEGAPLPEVSGREPSLFDLILDLQPAPSYAGAGLPAGYYAPGADPAALAEALDELPRMKGRFARPQFAAFMKGRCFHGRSRTRDCDRCLTVCPFGAIRSAAGSIVVDPYRCQGCGGCALVCPAEAISMRHPSREELLERLQNLFPDPSPDAGPGPLLEISEGEAAAAPAFPGPGPAGRLAFGVEQIGHVGLETLLAALTFGARQVVVACGPHHPPALREALGQQVRTGQAILRGLGLPEEMIRIAVTPQESGAEPAAIPWAEPGAGPQAHPLLWFSPGSRRRDLVRLATRRLRDRCAAAAEEIPLPAGAPFGGIAIDRAACTLCMACAVACPTGALLAGGDVPRIGLIESRCHQCGLCEEACPEGAVRLISRLRCDPAVIETPAPLNEAEPFRCVECGLPFASQAMVDRIRTKLSGHWMYTADRQLRRLQMCRTCRTRDALGDKEMSSWNRI
jgi:ferredoxin